MKFSAGEFKSLDFTDSSGNAQSLRPKDGVFTAETPEEIAVASSFGLTERSDAQVAASKARRSSSKPRGAKAPKLVSVAETGETDTRGPGAPAVEPGVTDKEG